MAQEVLYTREGDVQTLALGVPGLENLIIDHTGIPSEERSGLAKQLLASSALVCYGSMLAGALEARDVPFTAVKGKATLTLGPNTSGRGCVKRMLLEFSVTLPASGAEVFERCAKIMKNGCLITGSLHEGFEVVHELTAEYTEAC